MNVSSERVPPSRDARRRRDRRYASYAASLKASVTDGDSPHGRVAHVVDAHRLLADARLRFGERQTSHLTPLGLERILQANARISLTLAPPTQLDALQVMLETVVEEKIPGDVLEAGVYRGGQCVFMSGILRALGATDRHVLAADSFDGLPPPGVESSTGDALLYYLLSAIGRFAASAEVVRENLARHGLLDDRVRFIEGPFEHGLAGQVTRPLAVMRLDCTYESSTRIALEALYPLLSPGGFVLCADYGVPGGAGAAFDAFRAAHGITEPLETIDAQGVWWRKRSGEDSVPR